VKTQDMRARARAVAREASDSEAALIDGQIVVEYQPKVDLLSRRIVGAEALARWSHPDAGVLLPEAFLPLLDDSNLALPFATTVLRAAARQCAQWVREGFSGKVCVNISASLLADATLPERLAATVEQHCPPDRIILEISETGLMGDAARDLSVLARLRLKGFGLTIDDFGTGYSSLVDLYRLPCSELKIDRSLIAGVAHAQESWVIVRAIIELGHNLGLRVCAEGVEDKAAHDFLLASRCDLAQGIHYGGPMGPERISDLLRGPAASFSAPANTP
jgi:EAL domain-containing protein (putative c-di-GMP-specific phosphodiesterase class I)